MCQADTMWEVDGGVRGRGWITECRTTGGGGAGGGKGAGRRGKAQYAHPHWPSSYSRQTGQALDRFTVAKFKVALTMPQEPGWHPRPPGGRWRLAREGGRARFTNDGPVVVPSLPSGEDSAHHAGYCASTYCTVLECGDFGFVSTLLFYQ